MKRLFAIAILALGTAASAHADRLGLKDSTVRGQFVYSDDPHSRNQFAGQNPQIIGPGKEFSFDDGFATFSANFSADQLVFRVSCDTGITLRKCVNNEGPFVVVFRDRLFENATYNVISDSLGAIFLPSGCPLLLGDPRYIGVVVAFPWTQRDSTLVVSIVPAPEPSTVALMGTGLLAFAGTIRRRLRA